ncbi:hypothetical protein RintRC_4594 [Richelia intracellularis]|nr:hypothetical protein RintRC_4594 [Richelia intracellularis]
MDKGIPEPSVRVLKYPFFFHGEQHDHHRPFQGKKDLSTPP